MAFNKNKRDASGFLKPNLEYEKPRIRDFRNFTNNRKETVV
jgi:hypothetical protein